MSEKKQSSVEWLINEIDMQFPHIDIRWKERMIDWAKAMHKQEYIDAWMNGQNDSAYSQKELRKMAEKDYNQTYGDGKETKQR